MSFIKVLVTGGNGFVGQRLVNCLAADNEYKVNVLSRKKSNRLPSNSVQYFEVSDFSNPNLVAPALSEVDVVVHCAARVHMMDETNTDPEAEYRRINVETTLSLARSAAQSGVKRFIFLSSIKVNGEETVPGNPFTADDLPAPSDAYGRSKLKAEQELFALGQMCEMEIVVIRPVLVYGPGVKANFLSLIKLVDRNVPLPFGSVANSRSLVSIDNLVSLIQACITHPAAVGQVFLVSDGADISTPHLIRSIGYALGKPARLLRIPLQALNLLARITGKHAAAQRVFGSLVVDITKTTYLLGWTPPFSINDTLKNTVAHYREKEK